MIDRQVEDFLNDYSKPCKPGETFRQTNAVEVSPFRFLLAIFREMQGHEIRQAFLEVFRQEPVLCRIIGNAVETHRGIEAMTDEDGDPAERLKAFEYVTERNADILKKMLGQKAQGPPAERPIDEDENEFEK